jgi:hypothetical protein
MSALGNFGTANILELNEDERDRAVHEAWAKVLARPDKSIAPPTRREQRRRAATPRTARLGVPAAFLVRAAVTWGLEGSAASVYNQQVLKP